VDRKILVTSIGKLRDALERREGPVALVMLMASSAGAEDWNLVVSAAGFDRLPRAEAIRQLTALVRVTVSRRVWPTIHRVTVLPTEDPFVNSLNQFVVAHAEPVELHACNIGGIEIASALIFVSKRVAGSGTHPPRPQTLGGAAASS
jgi:hypothetical protein